MTNIGYFYHAFDQATIFTGHMHALAMDYRTKCYDALEAKAKESGVDKNIPVDDIIEYVESGRIEELKNIAITKYSQTHAQPEPEPEPEYDEESAQLSRTMTAA